MTTFTLLHGDCLTEMAAMDAGSVDAVCTDPPYGLEFMGKEWDKLWGGGKADWKERPKGGGQPFASDRPHYQAGTPAQTWHQAWATEALRVLKPSHYLLAFGGTRTWHRLACAIEDAGFEIRDTLMWLYGSGFPKGKSCLKPAWEPIILARKPGPMRELGIEECRIPMSGESPTALRRSYGYTPNLEKAAESEARGALCDRTDPAKRAAPHPSDNLGRWPANLILECTCDETREGTAGRGCTESHHKASIGYGGSAGPFETHDYGDTGRIHTDPNCPCAMLDGQTGTLGSGNRAAGVRKGIGYGSNAEGDGGPAIVGDSGGASRFFLNVPSVRAVCYDSPTLYEETSCGSETARDMSCCAGANREAGSSTPSPSTSPCGRPPTAQCLTDTSSITSTEPPTTTSSKTSTASREPITRCGIPITSEHAMALLSDAAASARNGNLWTPTTGAAKAGNGTARCAREHVGSSGQSTIASDSTPTCESTAAPRFLYAPKASRAERGEGNTHPTVKNLALMRWLVKLVARPGDVVLDPFAGSGTTGVACAMEGREFIGIEREAEYMEIARRRIEAASAQGRLLV